MSKIGLITGGDGLVGRQLVTYFRARGYTIISVDITHSNDSIQLDLRDQKKILKLVKTHKPNFIIHLAAIKDLLYCEQNKALTRITNFGLTENLVEACADLDIHFIYFSSDYVFANAEHPWTEEDPPCPTLQYAKDKADSETLIIKNLTNYTIVRTAQLYGYTNDFVNLVYNSLTSKQTFKAFANLINCPTWTGDLIRMLEKIVNHSHKGILHCVGPQALSRYEYAQIIAQSYNLDDSLIVATNLDFSTDIRPSRVELSGQKTYLRLQERPNTLEHNLSLHYSPLSYN